MGGNTVKYVAFKAWASPYNTIELPRRFGNSVDDLMGIWIDGVERKPDVIIDRTTLMDGNIATRRSSLMLIPDSIAGDRYLSCTVLAAMGMLLGAEPEIAGELDFATLVALIRGEGYDGIGDACDDSN